jgi:hypothetical protein
MLRWLKVGVFIAALGPATYLVYGAFANTLGANPIDAITDETGTWTLRFLVLTLLVTPLRKWTGWNSLIKFRRMLGLFAFFYGSLHFLTFLVFDHYFDLDGRLDSPAGWQAVEPAPQACVCVRSGRRRALLVAGQERHLPPGTVRSHRRRSARDSRLVRLQCAPWDSLACCCASSSCC